MTATVLAALPAPIDPLRRPARDGAYDDGVVVVRRRGHSAPTAPTVRTRHFTVCHEDGRVHLEHRVPTHHVDDDLAGLLRDELFSPGALAGADLFERLFTGVVVAGEPDPARAWERFYRASLTRLARPAATGHRSGSLAAFAPVHRHAIGLVEGRSVLEVGSCFGFLSLQMASAGHDVVASDVCPGTTRLLARMATRLRRPLATLTCDATAVPLPASSVDTVIAAHVIEHLDPGQAAAVVDEATRVARRRLIVAVPDEDEPQTAYGHRWAVRAEDLAGLGDHHGWDTDIHEWHGRWLVMTARPETRRAGAQGPSRSYCPAR